jgi:hypothetical protein
MWESAVAEAAVAVGDENRGEGRQGGDVVILQLDRLSKPAVVEFGGLVIGCEASKYVDLCNATDMPMIVRFDKLPLSSLGFAFYEATLGYLKAGSEIQILPRSETRLQVDFKPSSLNAGKVVRGTMYFKVNGKFLQSIVTSGTGLADGPKSRIEASSVRLFAWTLQILICFVEITECPI